MTTITVVAIGKVHTVLHRRDPSPVLLTATIVILRFCVHLSLRGTCGEHRRLPSCGGLTVRTLTVISHGSLTIQGVKVYRHSPIHNVYAQHVFENHRLFPSEDISLKHSILFHRYVTPRTRLSGPITTQFHEYKGFSHVSSSSLVTVQSVQVIKYVCARS
jgi:hypothetical protein